MKNNSNTNDVDATPATLDVPDFVLPEVEEWSTVRTKSRCEKALAEYLEKRNVSVYLPLVENRRIYGARVRTSLLPLFPGYVFFDGGAVDPSVVFESKKAAQILKADEPQELQQELRNLSIALQGDRKLRQVRFGTTGTPVEVVRGPLQGVNGELLRLGGAGKLIIRIRHLNLAAELTVDEAYVRVCH